MSELQVSSVFDQSPQLLRYLISALVQQYEPVGIGIKRIAKILGISVKPEDKKAVGEYAAAYQALAAYLIKVLRLDQEFKTSILTAWAEEVGQEVEDSDLIVSPQEEALVRTYAIGLLVMSEAEAAEAVGIDEDGDEVDDDEYWDDDGEADGDPELPLAIQLINSKLSVDGELLMKATVLREIYDQQHSRYIQIITTLEEAAAKGLFQASVIAKRFNDHFSTRFFSLLFERLRSDKGKSRNGKFTVIFRKNNVAYFAAFEEKNHQEIRVSIWKESGENQYEYAPVLLLFDEEGTMVMASEVDDALGQESVKLFFSLLTYFNLATPNEIMIQPDRGMSIRELNHTLGEANTAKDVVELMYLLNQRFGHQVFLEAEYTQQPKRGGLPQRVVYPQK